MKRCDQHLIGRENLEHDGHSYGGVAVSVANLNGESNPTSHIDNWEMVLPDSSELSKDSVQAVKDRCCEILDEGIRGLHSTASILKLALSLTTAISTEEEESNSHSLEVSVVLDKLKEIETLVNRLNDNYAKRRSFPLSDNFRQDSDFEHFRPDQAQLLKRSRLEPITVISESSEDCSETPTDREPVPKNDPVLRVKTRSRGPVADLPNVQQKTLEYRLRGRSHSS